MITSGGIPLPDDSTTDYLNSLSVIINSIDTSLKDLYSNFAWRCTTYQYKTEELFANISTTNPTPTPEYFKKKYKLLLTDIGGMCYGGGVNNPPPPKRFMLKSETLRRIKRY